MALVAPYPIYNAGKTGLVSPFNITFDATGEYYVPLLGSIQGDPVKAVCIYVSNLTSGSIIGYSIRGNYGNIPPYSDGYINIVDCLDIRFFGPGGVTLNGQILNYDSPEGFVQRGSSPTLITSDTYYSKVLTLLHCEGVNNGSTIFDSKNNTILNVVAPAKVDTTKFKFGNSCVNANGGVGANAATIDLSSAVFPFSIELFFQVPSGLASDDYSFIQITGFANRYFGFRIVGGLITGFVRRDSINEFIGFPMPVDEWNYIAININSTTDMRIFINGTFVFNFTSVFLNGAITNMFLVNRLGSQLNRCLYDEIRVTNYPRFLSSAPVPDMPFLEQ